MAGMPEPDQERFDTIGSYVVLAIVALVAATWIGVTIRRLYY